MTFNKHLQENNKNLKVLQEMEDRWKRRKAVYKNHQRASKYGSITQKKVNPCISYMFQIVVKRVKEMYCKLPNKADRVMIELPLKDSPSEPSALYCIITSTSYLYIECDYLNNYKVEYQFHRCPFEEEIQQLINKMALRAYSTEIMNQPDYPTFFTNCLRVQPERFITLL